MYRLSLVMALGLWIALVTAAPAQAQNWYELNAHVGGFRYDIEDSDTDVLLGARMMLQYQGGFAWGGNFDWVNVDRIDVPGVDDDVKLDLYLYSFGLEYAFPMAGQFRPFVAGGVGAATGRIDDIPGRSDDDTSKTHLLVPVGAGFKWYNAPPPRASWALRADIRDNIIFVGDESVIFGSDETKNNFEYSGGISFIF